MLRKLILATAALAALATPTLAADWYIVRTNAAPVDEHTACLVVDRKAAAGEEGIAGPFASQQRGLAALDAYAACDGRQHT